jgi:hypothetical protein
MSLTAIIGKDAATIRETNQYEVPCGSQPLVFLLFSTPAHSFSVTCDDVRSYVAQYGKGQGRSVRHISWRNSGSDTRGKKMFSDDRTTGFLILIICCLVVFMMAVAALFSPVRAHDHNNPELDGWYAGLMQPDNPTASCCGKADAYWCDDYYAKGGKASAGSRMTG